MTEKEAIMIFVACCMVTLSVLKIVYKEIKQTIGRWSN